MCPSLVMPNLDLEYIGRILVMTRPVVDDVRGGDDWVVGEIGKVDAREVDECGLE